MSKTAIRVENLGKRYNIGAPQIKYQTLRDKLSEGLKRKEKREDSFIWALKDVSFEIKEGSVLGVVGRNGAGKSTLLKILSRVTEPTEGLVEIRGRVGSLLEVGTGFHPELTGRENIFLNGAILGMKRTEIDKKFDEIVTFAEVEKFIDTPVKRYSSGMYLRLAFAVAAHLEPEILVVDEVLAVGDAEFQKKCLGKMSDVAQEGRTVLFVSHNMSAVLRLTQETLVIDHGQLLMRGPTPEAIDYYLSKGLTEEGQKMWLPEEVATAHKPFRPIAIRVLDKSGNISEVIRSVEPFTVEIEYELEKSLKGLRVGIYLLTTRGEYIFTSFDTDDAKQYENRTVREAGRYISRCEIPGNLLNEGRYVIGVNASTYMIKRYFQDDQALLFSVDPAGAPGMQWIETRLGPIRPALNWKIENFSDDGIHNGK
ncbi:MAG: ABC transporter ATP-binding protein [Chloroflexi bacterium]|jgi:lipopolysaccharide transport system ATP-binding protein|nr:ABC transporter ATP-binding protein [Chloroflexota bacterium]